MLQYRRIGVTVKPNLTDKERIVQTVVHVLRAQGAEVFIDPPSCADLSCTRMLPPLERSTDVDLMLVIGGDGTILRAVRELKDFSVPILSVNRGVVGFLAELAFDDASETLPRLLKGEGCMEERALLSVRVYREKVEIMRTFALNEASVSQGAIARLLDLRTDINGEPLANFHADGLIVATPTGSTAYSLAAGGPIVHPHLPALVLTPINPHSLTQKPIVIPGGSEVGVDVSQPGTMFNQSQVSLTLDGQVYHPLMPNDRVIVRMHDQTVRFIRRNKDSFYHTLRTKLRWGERM